MSDPSMVTRELLEKIREKPFINFSPLPDYDYDHLDYGMTQGIERTSGGRLWSCWVGGGDSPEAYDVVACSDDDGETWSEPYFVVDPHREDLPFERCTRAGMFWNDPLGRLWFFFQQTFEMFDGCASNWFIRCDRPDDPRPVWTEPAYVGVGASINKPIVLSNGEWMLPVSLWERWHISEPFRHCFHELDPIRGASVFVSRDQGITWGWRGCVIFPDSEFNEHMVVERKDGVLWMMSRTKYGIGESFSTDLGRTWSRPRKSAIGHLTTTDIRTGGDIASLNRSQSSRFHIRRTASGRLLLVKHGTEIDKGPGARSHLCAYLSDNDGASWSRGFLLDERSPVSYPDVAQAPDGRLYIQYDRERKALGEILFARITEEDILAGRLVGKKSALKKLVSRPRGRTRKQQPRQTGGVEDTSGPARVEATGGAMHECSRIRVGASAKPVVPRRISTSIKCNYSGTICSMPPVLPSYDLHNILHEEVCQGEQPRGRGQAPAARAAGLANGAVRRQRGHVRRPVPVRHGGGTAHGAAVGNTMNFHTEPARVV